MYDIINLPIQCPICHTFVDNCYTFQLEQLEETYSPGDIITVEANFTYIKGTAKCNNPSCHKRYFDIYIPHHQNVILDRYYYKTLEEKGI